MKYIKKKLTIDKVKVQDIAKKFLQIRFNEIYQKKTDNR